MRGHRFESTFGDWSKQEKTAEAIILILWQLSNNVLTWPGEALDRSIWHLKTHAGCKANAAKMLHSIVSHDSPQHVTSSTASSKTDSRVSKWSCSLVAGFRPNWQSIDANSRASKASVPMTQLPKSKWHDSRAKVFFHRVCARVCMQRWSGSCVYATPLQTSWHRKSHGRTAAMSGRAVWQQCTCWTRGWPF